MSETKERLCISCMHPVDEGAASCPYCGYNGTQQNPDSLLPIGTRLNKGSYIAGKVLKVNSHSVDYAGYSVNDMLLCTVREYYPAGGVIREAGETRLSPAAGCSEKYKTGLEEFVKTYKIISADSGETALPKQYCCFTENGTAYYIYESFEGMTLKELLKRNGAPLSFAQTKLIMGPVLTALETLHGSGLVHGGICPDNILINDNGDVRITGFSSHKDADAQGLVGYLAPEVSAGGEISEKADVYSVGAVFYRCVTGTVPQDANQRRSQDNLVPVSELDEDLSDEMSAVISEAMMVASENRTEDIRTLRDRIYEMAVVKEDEEEGEGPDEPSEEEKRLVRWKAILAIAVCFFVVMLAVFVMSIFIRKSIAEKRKDNGEISQVLVEVPDYVGKTIGEVEFDTLTFDYLIINTYNDGPADVVTGQDPPRGSGLGREDRLITLYVNREKGKVVKLGNYFERNALEVLDELNALGITYQIVYAQTDRYDPGVVMGQDPGAGYSMSLDETLVLVISKKK